MKCHILFSSKNKKNISKCCLLKFLLSMQMLNYFKKKKKKGKGQMINSFYIYIYYIYIFFFLQKIGLNISCKLSHLGDKFN